MKKAVILYLVLMILVCVILFSQGPSIEEGTKVTVTCIVTDRAMAENTPYLSVTLPDGTDICLWDPEESNIPEDVHIGDEITVTYGKESGKDRYIILEIA